MPKSEQVRDQPCPPKVTTNALPPERREASRAGGHDEFAACVQRVGQQLASGRATFLPEEPR